MSSTEVEAATGVSAVGSVVEGFGMRMLGIRIVETGCGGFPGPADACLPIPHENASESCAACADYGQWTTKCYQMRMHAIEPSIPRP